MYDGLLYNEKQILKLMTKKNVEEINKLEASIKECNEMIDSVEQDVNVVLMNNDNKGLFAEQNYKKNKNEVEEIEIDEIKMKIGKNLSNEHKIELSNYLEYARTHEYALDRTPITGTTVVEHCINTGDKPPVHSKPYKLTPEKREIVNQTVQDLLKNKMIVHSRSPYASPVVVVQKKTGDARVCCDFRKLNMDSVHWTLWMIRCLVKTSMIY